MTEDTFMGTPRNLIIWFPLIDREKCDLCQGTPQYLKFCPHDVYSFNSESDTLKVLHPDHCVVFCRSCQKVCPPNALSFPEKSITLNHIRELRKEMKDKK